MKPNAVCMHASYVVPRVSTQLIRKFRHHLAETGGLTWYFPIFTMACIFVSSHTALWVSLVAQMVKNLPGMRETWVQSLGWEDPLEEGMASHSSILAWRIPMDRGAWRAAVRGVAKSQTRLSNYTFTFILSSGVCIVCVFK